MRNNLWIESMRFKITQKMKIHSMNEKGTENHLEGYYYVGIIINGALNEVPFFRCKINYHT